MLIKAEEQQKSALLNVLKRIGTTSYGRRLGVDTLSRSGSLAELHTRFAEKVPVRPYEGFIQSCRQTSGDMAATPTSLFARAGFVTAEAPAGFAPEDGDHARLLPVSTHMLKSFHTVEQDIQTTYRKQWPALVKGTYFYICEDASIEYIEKYPAGDLLALQMTYKGLLSKRQIAPELTDIQSVGKSRNQVLMVYADELKRFGGDVQTLVTSPKTLTDLCFLLAQREGRFVALKELAPQLQLCLFTENPSVYLRELYYFFAGLELGLANWYARPYGLQAWQADMNIMGVLGFPEGDDVFYEFIPLSDIDPHGRLKKGAQRLHVGQTVPGKDYLLVVTNTQGVIGYQTNDVVRIVDRMPLTFSMQRPATALNGFGEQLTADVSDKLIQSFNEALVSYGFFIRDYMVGDRAADRCPHWLIELSRPPQDIPEKVLQSVTNRLHRELATSLPSYQSAFQHNRTFPPSMHFMPMGSFTHMPSPFKFQRFDQTTEAEVIEKVLARVGTGAVQLRAPLL